MTRIGVLGPLEVCSGGDAPLRVPDRKVRLLLAALVARGGGPVPVDRLIDDLWGDRPPRDPAGTLQARVSQLRRALGAPSLVVHGPSGYRLDGVTVDADLFLTRLAAPAEGARERAGRLAEALALWRGPAYADFADEGFARPEITRLDERRLAALEELAELRLVLGEPVDLAALVAEHPLRERLTALHMRALYRDGRQGEALAVFAALRERLAGELGVDPAPEVRDLHRAILRQEPGLLGRPVRDRRDATAGNLPAPVAGLIGRDGEVAELRALLGERRLVTLAGPGGVGKTRLAVEVAHGLTGPGAYPGGVWLVELIGAGDVAEAVAGALGVRDDGSGPLLPRLARALAARRTLLVLDNCEHLVDRAAEVVSALLRAVPGLTVLVTGQEPLGVRGEHVKVLPPLAEDAAVRLFTDRAGIEPGPAVAAICRRLDGIPLALELAATRVRALGVEELAARLDDRFRLLSAGARDAPARQRTLRAMIDWSWELLSDRERIVLRRLAAHADGCTLEAAEEVCAEPGVDVMDVLARLVQRSLVTPGPRHRLLESVAAYCAERLREAGEDDLVRERHARYYTRLAERAELRGPRQRAWLERLDQESANLRRALAGPEPLRTADALAWYWFLRGRLGEARRSLTAALASSGAAADRHERARAAVWLSGMTLAIGEPARPVPYEDLDAAGRALADWFPTHVRWAYGDLAAHEEAAGRALRAFEELGDRWGVAAALSLRSKLAERRGGLAEMRRDAERSLAIFRELGDGWGRIEAMDGLDRLAQMRGDYAEAERLRHEALELAEELGSEVSFRLSAVGRLALVTGDYARADDYHERARRLAVEQSYKSAEEHAELGLAMSARRQGRYERAEELLLRWLDWLSEVRGAPGTAFFLAELGFVAEQRGDAETALARHRKGYAAALGDPRAEALALEGLAGAYSLAGDAERAARLLGRAAALRAAVGTPLPDGERHDVGRITARALAALGEEAFSRAYASGERELGDDLPGAFRGGAGVQAAPEGLDALGHAHEAEAAAETGQAGVGG
ncbi:BTAD domain-containing putative transcriptional regulator [Nonomuraea sp. CA-218870]|uniref:BTAD domain-containing putative transcriptional regulator n=1 Tax=Nonomuraea sp. CA-218870 TaxID=3239998 RepID=UPI003D8D9C02